MWKKVNIFLFSLYSLFAHFFGGCQEHSDNSRDRNWNYFSFYLFRLKCFNSFVFSFYSEIILNNSSKAFALDPCCSEKKSIFDLNRNRNVIIQRKHTNTFVTCKRVNSSMNLITAGMRGTFLMDRWNERNIPGPLISYLHNIHTLTRNKI